MEPQRRQSRSGTHAENAASAGSILVSDGWPWLLLEDSFVIALVCRGISGLVLCSRGRSPRQVAFSIDGAALLPLLVVIGAPIS